jgi:hypothetical protein
LEADSHEKWQYLHGYDVMNCDGIVQWAYHPLPSSYFDDVHPWLPSGKRLHNELENHHAING